MTAVANACGLPVLMSDLGLVLVLGLSFKDALCRQSTWHYLT